MANRVNVGGSAAPWVAYSTRGRWRFTTGGGWLAWASRITRFSAAVGMRVWYASSAWRSAGRIRCVIFPVSAETVSTGAYDEEREPVGDRRAGRGPAFGVEQVPLVQHDDDRGAGGVDPLGEALVLVGHAVGGVDHEQRGVGAVDGLERADQAEVLGRLVDAAAAAHAGGVDEAQRAVVGLDDGVDGVARGARHVVDDRALVADQPVEQRRLPDVGAPDDRDREEVVVVVVVAVEVVGLGELGDHVVEEVAAPPPVDGRDRDRVAEAEPRELPDVGLAALVVDLVRDERAPACPSAGAPARRGRPRR